MKELIKIILKICLDIFVFSLLFISFLNAFTKIPNIEGMFAFIITLHLFGKYRDARISEKLIFGDK